MGADKRALDDLLDAASGAADRLGIQQRLFGDQGRSDGALLASLREVEHDRSPG